ncbi:MAG: hypothetical protein L7F77_01090 [Candidatus Magnetominusculus sp. LBB02]|nr:hypothetical protein [Candidatus Magnetominusculus sp. LBB02]
MSQLEQASEAQSSHDIQLPQSILSVHELDCSVPCFFFTSLAGIEKCLTGRAVYAESGIK